MRIEYYKKDIDWQPCRWISVLAGFRVFYSSLLKFSLLMQSWMLIIVSGLLMGQTTGFNSTLR